MSKPEQEAVGGAAFFASLLVLPVVGVGNFLFLPPLLDRLALLHWLGFLGAFWLGLRASQAFIRGSWSVFIHEHKHSVLSSLAGNRAKHMKVRSRSGQFAYEYTKDTAAYNAFISLAPYMLPLFTLVTVVLGSLFLHQLHPVLVCLVGISAGIDIDLARRDIGSHQSDIYLIRGGYGVGLAYIVFMNMAQFSFLAAWISKGLPGLQALGMSWWKYGLALVEAFGIQVQ